MTKAKPHLIRRSLVLFTALVFCVGGCGGSTSSTQAGPLKDRDGIAAALPKGVTLETPIVPDKLYGESAKTVEDALASLQAYVKNGVLQDGGMGHEIQFDTGSKSTKKASKTPKNAYIVIQLAH